MSLEIHNKEVENYPIPGSYLKPFGCKAGTTQRIDGAFIQIEIDCRNCFLRDSVKRNFRSNRDVVNAETEMAEWFGKHCQSPLAIAARKEHLKAQ